MKFTPLEKSRAKELETITTSYLNVLSHDDLLGVDPMLVHQFHNWADDSTTERANPDGIFFKGLYEKARYISDKLGMKTSFWVTYYVKHAVWGFEYNGNEYLLYFSNEGLSLQMLDTTSGYEVLACISEIIKRWKS